MHLEGRICVATDSSTVALRPGSIDQVIRYLEVWLGHGGHGIAGMQERMAIYGGEFSAHPSGPGFRVMARLPVPAAGR